MGGGGGWFCLADKYSNQMSVPLWDPEAQIQAIPGSSLIQKNPLCGLYESVLEYKCTKKGKGKKTISKANHLSDAHKHRKQFTVKYLIMGLFLKSP